MIFLNNWYEFQCTVADCISGGYLCIFIILDKLCEFQCKTLAYCILF